MKWDRGVSYDTLKHQFLTFFKYRLADYLRKPSKNRAKSLLYVSTALIQLANGLRAGETLISMRKLYDVQENPKQIEIFVFKKKKRKRLKDGRVVEKRLSEFEKRKVIIPETVRVHKNYLHEWFARGFGLPDKFMPIKFENPFEREKNVKEYKKCVRKYGMWLEKNFNVNSHTLRYAFNNKFLELAPTELVAKFQGRTDLNVLLEYVRERKATQLFNELIDF